MSNKKKDSSSVFDKKVYNDLCLSYKDKYKKEEEWKRVIIDNVPTKYAVSNYGRVFNLDKKESTSIYYHNKHYSVYISLPNGQSRRFGTYRLVALMFLPSPIKYLERGYSMADLVVDHKRDGDEDNFDDNTMWNLQWLTNRENTAKAANCGYREAFEYGFRQKLDRMILDGYNNKEIYEWCLNDYGYKKEDIKATLQVRRRRLGKTLKEHHENDKDFVKKIDKLLLKGFSNDEIIDILNMPDDGRASRRLLQYRRSILKTPAETSKYFTPEQNEIVNKLLDEDVPNKEIIRILHFDNLDEDSLTKIKATLRARRRQHKQKHKIASSTTIEKDKTE